MIRRPTSFLTPISILLHPRITHDPVMTLHPFHPDYLSQPLPYLLPYFTRIPTILLPTHFGTLDLDRHFSGPPTMPYPTTDGSLSLSGCSSLSFLLIVSCFTLGASRSTTLGYN